MSPNQWTKHAGRTAEASLLVVRLSKEERAQTERDARAADLTLSEFVRRKLGHVPKDHKPLGRRGRAKPTDT